MLMYIAACEVVGSVHVPLFFAHQHSHAVYICVLLKLCAGLLYLVGSFVGLISYWMAVSFAIVATDLIFTCTYRVDIRLFELVITARFLRLLLPPQITTTWNVAVPILPYLLATYPQYNQVPGTSTTNTVTTTAMTENPMGAPAGATVPATAV